MKKKFIIGLLTIPLIWISCEEVIKIDLEGVDPRMVIEGYISDQPGPYTIRISKTTDYFEPSEYPMVSNATVIISDDLGARDTLIEIENGIYQTTSSQGDYGRTYHLDVAVEGMHYSGSATLPDLILIDSIETEYYPETYYYEEAYWLHCHYKDPLDTLNYYRVRSITNDTLDKTIYVLDDKFIDGNPVDFFIWGDSYQPGDTVIFELYSMDEALYNYFYTLFNLLYSGGDGSYSTPADPNTNLSNNALGYFGAFSIDRDTIVVPEFPDQ